MSVVEQKKLTKQHIVNTALSSSPGVGKGLGTWGRNRAGTEEIAAPRGWPWGRRSCRGNYPPSLGSGNRSLIEPGDGRSSSVRLNCDVCLTGGTIVSDSNTIEYGVMKTYWEGMFVTVTVVTAGEKL